MGRVNVAGITYNEFDGEGRDPVTGLVSRSTVLSSLVAATSPSDRTIGGVVVVDIDRFHQLNHMFGFDTADRILRIVGHRMEERLRASDRLARIGADEFLLILEGPVEPHLAREIAVRLLESVERSIRMGGEDVFVTACAGVALADHNEVDGLQLIRRATGAVREAKEQGRSKVAVSSAADHAERLAGIRTERSLRQAFEHRELQVHYQPEFSLTDRTVIGTEALVRWAHPSRGMLAAESFINIAEDAGLSGRLGTWVLGEAMRDAENWHDAGYPITVRVNLSTQQLLDDTIVIDLRTALNSHEVGAQHVCLEVTESHLLPEIDQSVRTLERLKNLGVQVALDDFGTGYSSMVYLKALPVDVLKIDRTFVAGIGTDPDDTAIVSSIIRLGQELGLEVVAEGIEKERQVAELVALGCERGQGFHLARPMSAAGMSSLLVEPRRRPAIGS